MNPVSLTLTNAVLAATLTKQVERSTGTQAAQFRGVPSECARAGEGHLDWRWMADRVEREPVMVPNWASTGSDKRIWPGALESSASSLAGAMLTDGGGWAQAAVSG